jgi:Cys-tRNA synthase (O-phospho-L-seryl-tRNA:Cys-tRNA synthase)
VRGKWKVELEKCWEMQDKMGTGGISGVGGRPHQHDIVDKFEEFGEIRSQTCEISAGKSDEYGPSPVKMQL